MRHKQLFLVFLILFTPEATISSTRRCHECRDDGIIQMIQEEKNYIGLDKLKIDSLTEVVPCDQAYEDDQLIPCENSCIEIVRISTHHNYTMRSCIKNLLLESPGGLNLSNFNGTGVDYLNAQKGGEWRFAYCNDDECWNPGPPVPKRDRLRELEEALDELIPEQIQGVLRIGMALLCIVIMLSCCYSVPKGNKEKNLAQYNVRPFNIPERTVNVAPEYVQMLDEYLDPNFSPKAQRALGSTVVTVENVCDEAERERRSSHQKQTQNSETSIPLSAVTTSTSLNVVN